MLNVYMLCARGRRQRHIPRLLHPVTLPRKRRMGGEVYIYMLKAYMLCAYSIGLTYICIQGSRL